MAHPRAPEAIGFANRRLKASSPLLAAAQGVEHRAGRLRATEPATDPRHRAPAEAIVVAEEVGGAHRLVTAAVAAVTRSPARRMAGSASDCR